MRVADWISLVFVAALLAACGGEDADKAATAQQQAAPSAAASGGGRTYKSMTAAEVAKAERGNLKCPAKISTPPRPTNTPVDDVVGVRTGMTLEDAANVVMCSNELTVVKIGSSRQFRVNTYGQALRQGFTAQTAEPYQEKSSQQILREMQSQTISSAGARQGTLLPGQSRWHVGTMGMPGREVVYSVSREEVYDEGRNPTMASVAEALKKKYGAVTTREERTPLVHALFWSYTPAGELIAPRESMAMRCGASSDPDGPVNLMPECGVAVAATISSMRSNPDLAESLQVGALEQAIGYALLHGTQKGLDEMEAKRRAKAVEEAAENADKPTL
jgi:hypothetical protein